jgi:hypothetical protein
MSRLLALLQEVSVNPEAQAKYRGRAGERREEFLELMRTYHLTEDEQRAVLEDDDDAPVGFDRIELDHRPPRNGNVRADRTAMVHSYRDLR